MDVRSLIGFVTVAEELNFRRAAGRLHLSQPGLSRLVARLEREVGVLLLDRSTTHVELTGPGAVFLEHARSVLTAIEEAVRLTRENGSASSPRLRVGLSEWAERLVPPALHTLRRTTPAVQLEVDHVESGSLVEELCAERFDVAFCRAVPQDGRIDAEPLVDEPLVAAVPAGHPLQDEEPLDMSVLADEALVLFPRQLAPSAHDQVVDLCDRAGFQPYIAHETVPLAATAALVAAGMGIALVPASTGPRFDPAHVTCHRIDAPTPTMPLVAARRRSDTSSTVDQLLEVASDELKGAVDASSTAGHRPESGDEILDIHG